MLINYKADRSSKRWNGTAIIPLTYLPVNASKLNVFSYHGLRDKRVVNALYPVENIATAELDEYVMFHTLAAYLYNYKLLKHFLVINWHRSNPSIALFYQLKILISCRRFGRMRYKGNILEMQIF